MSAPDMPSRVQLMVLRNLCGYDALPCTAPELASAAKQSTLHVEQYLEQLRAGRWVSKRNKASGAVWQPTDKGLAVASAEVQA
ncbi:hypothetical protein ACFWPK_22530 [Nocardia sp. NPDC058519]|uniref:hypothetical protein n=1 Tax=Nocardia sp. NPDC058519 TaxID=3346535 RepID=UPI00364AB0E4